MKLKQRAGLTSQIWQIIIDDSSSAVGAGLTGLAHNASGLTAKYKKQGDASWTTITLATATGGSYTSGGFVESDSGAGGGYEFHVPDAAIATAGKVWIELFGAANMAPVRIEVELDAVDYQTARFGASDGANVTLAADSVNAAAISADAGAKLAALVEAYIVNEGDATATIQAIADRIASDWVMGDASPVAVATAVWANATRSLTEPVEITSPAIDRLEGLIEDVGGDQFTAKAVSQAPSGSGDGIHTLTITIQDASENAIQGARVAIDGTNSSQTSKTNGQVVFNVNSGTYSLVVSPPAGYETPDPVSKTVGADATETIELAVSSGTSGVGWLG